MIIWKLKLLLSIWYLDHVLVQFQNVIRAGLLKEGICSVQDESAGKVHLTKAYLDQKKS